MLKLFKKKPVDPVDRLKAATDEFNAALQALPPGCRLSPWVERRPGLRSLLVLQQWTPGTGFRAYPHEDPAR